MKKFNLSSIESCLQDYKRNFKKINVKIDRKREDFTSGHIHNILEGYEFLNSLISKEIDLLSVAGMYQMVELNHIVLCGTATNKRVEYYKHLIKTREKFITHIGPISKWLKKQGKTDPYEVAAGFYSRALSFPQLFVEGNHRTENMVINYYLAGKNLPPYVVTTDTAILYLNISGNIKFGTKKKLIDDIKRKHYTAEFQKFIRLSGDSSHLLHGSR